VDRASNSKEAGIRIVLTTPKGSIIEQSFTLGFPSSNNEAKYEAVLTRLRVATTLRVTGPEVQCLSLVINQVSRKYAARDAQIEKYLQFILGLKCRIPRCELKWVPISENNQPDSLA